MIRSVGTVLLVIITTYLTMINVDMVVTVTILVISIVLIKMKLIEILAQNLLFLCNSTQNLT